MGRRRRRRVISLSPQETIQFGKELAQELSVGAVVCFFGDLGAGKTTLIKGIVHALTDESPTNITSPTFTYLQSYDYVHHFDLYRLEREDDFVALGFDEYLSSGICCIEWSEKIASLIPEEAIRITLRHLNEEQREIEVA